MNSTFLKLSYSSLSRISQVLKVSNLISGYRAILLVLLLIGSTTAQALVCFDGGGYNTVKVLNCTKGDDVIGSGQSKDTGVLYLTVTSYNS